MSVASDISAAIATGVRSLALVPSASVVERKVPTLPEGEDPPQIVVSVAEEGLSEPLTGVLDAVRYPVQVTIITGGGAKLEPDAIRLWREQIRGAVNKGTTFSGVTGFERVEPAGRAPYFPAALQKDLNYSVLVFTVEVTEARAR